LDKLETPETATIMLAEYDLDDLTKRHPEMGIAHVFAIGMRMVATIGTVMPVMR
jgi:hypothetical protein